MSSDDLLHRIDSEFADDAEPGLTTVADKNKTYLLDNGATDEIIGDEPALKLVSVIGEMLRGGDGNNPEIIRGGPWHEQLRGGDDTPRGPGSYQDNPGSIYKTEWDHQLDMFSRAQVGPNGQPVDDLDMFTQVQEQQREEENAESQFTNSNPPSLNRGNLGQSVTLNAGAVTTGAVYNTFADGPSQMVAFWPGDDRDVQAITVTAQPNVPISTSKIVKLVAKVNWGVHGAKFTVFIDVGTGIEFALNASNAYVELFLEGDSYNNASTPANTSYVAAGSIGFKNTSRTQALVRAVRKIGTSGGTVTVTRPAFASSLVAFDSDLGAGSVTLNFLDAMGQIVFTRVYAANAFITTPVSMPADVVQVQFVPTSSGVYIATLTFGLF